jgi:hypothetical protein
MPATIRMATTAEIRQPRFRQNEREEEVVMRISFDTA